MAAELVSISPIWNGAQFFDNDGKPLAGGLLYQFEANSFTVNRTSYTTDAGTIANANPIVLDASGRLQTDLWLVDGQAYNLVLKDKLLTILKSVDDVTGVQAASSSSTATAIWNPADGTPTYVSSNQFLLAGNQATNFAVGNRVRVLLSTGYVYGTVRVVSFTSPNTTVTLVMDNGTTLNSSLTTVDYSALIANGRTVDAGGVSYSVTALSYAVTGTVGNKLRSLDADNAAQNITIASPQKVYAASGAPTYQIFPDTPTTAYSITQSWNVQFNAASTGAATLNVSLVGALALKQYAADGSLVDPTITAGMCSQVVYDGTRFILLDQLPPAAAASAPHGSVSFASNTTWTCPAGLTAVRVLCVGGGGGGGAGGGTGGESPIFYSGGTGGSGGGGWSTVAVTPGTGYAISIGTGGFASDGFSAAGAGGNTTFGASLVQATGGAGGGNSPGNAPGTDGASGYGNIATYGTYGTVYAIGGAPKGAGGAGGGGSFSFFGNAGANGTSGMIALDW